MAEISFKKINYKTKYSKNQGKREGQEIKRQNI